MFRAVVQGGSGAKTIRKVINTLLGSGCACRYDTYTKREVSHNQKLPMSLYKHDVAIACTCLYSKWLGSGHTTGWDWDRGQENSCTKARYSIAGPELPIWCISWLLLTVGKPYPYIQVKAFEQCMFLATATCIREETHTISCRGQSWREHGYVLQGECS